MGAASFIARRGEDVTLQTRALDTAARDATTKWPTESYTESTIKAILRPERTGQVDVGGVRETQQGMEILTASVITAWSRVVYNRVTYTIVAEPFAHRKRGVTQYHSAPLERMT